MIKFKDKKKRDIELELYEAKVEEALAKWEAAKAFEVPRETKIPPPREYD